MIDAGMTYGLMREIARQEKSKVPNTYRLKSILWIATNWPIELGAMHRSECHSKVRLPIERQVESAIEGGPEVRLWPIANRRHSIEREIRDATRIDEFRWHRRTADPTTGALPAQTVTAAPEESPGNIETAPFAFDGQAKKSEWDELVRRQATFDCFRFENAAIDGRWRQMIRWRTRVDKYGLWLAVCWTIGSGNVHALQRWI